MSVSMVVPKMSPKKLPKKIIPTKKRNIYKGGSSRLNRSRSPDNKVNDFRKWNEKFQDFKFDSRSRLDFISDESNKYGEQENSKNEIMFSSLSRAERMALSNRINMEVGVVRTLSDLIVDCPGVADMWYGGFSSNGDSTDFARLLNISGQLNSMLWKIANYGIASNLNEATEQISSDFIKIGRKFSVGSGGVGASVKDYISAHYKSKKISADVVCSGTSKCLFFVDGKKVVAG